MSILSELDEACLELDMSPDFNPICTAKETDFCEHGFLFMCPGCGADFVREQPEREAKHRAYDLIHYELQEETHELVDDSDNSDDEGGPRRSPRNHTRNQ
jgi:hypothetical protein